MSITVEVLEQRKASLQARLSMSEDEHEVLKESNKNIKKEISNIKGAIIEIDRLIDNCQ